MMVSDHGNSKFNKKLDIDSVVDFVGGPRIFHGGFQHVFRPKRFEERGGNNFLC